MHLKCRIASAIGSQVSACEAFTVKRRFVEPTKSVQVTPQVPKLSVALCNESNYKDYIKQRETNHMTKIVSINEPAAFVLYLERDKKFVGIDTTSGGYPYRTNFVNAGRFASIKEAAQYCSGNTFLYVGEQPIIMEVGATILTECKYDVEAEYQEELAALNAKYGK